MGILIFQIQRTKDKRVLRMEDINEILKNLSNFVAAISTSLAPEDSPADWLDNLLKEKLDFNETGEILDVRWNYVTKGLELLQRLKNSLKDKDCLGDTLSVGQQQNVSATIQMVIALGIVPSLLQVLDFQWQNVPNSMQ